MFHWGMAPLTLLFLQLRILVYVKKHLSEKKGDVMYRAAKHAGMNLPALESGGHVVGRIKRVELNLEA